ncbi:MAG: tetratricopeptide repeat protein [Armatimonadota bacterium]
MRHTAQGTVTLLFTDIEGSSRLWEQHPDAMQRALAQHDDILRAAIEANWGRVFKTGGDAFYAVFDDERDALEAALQAQRRLHAEAWPEGAELRVRMALHAGPAQERDGDYFGAPLNRIARLLSCAHGGQTLLSRVMCELVRGNAPEGVCFHDLGQHRLRDLATPERIFQLIHPDLRSEFPPLRSLQAFSHNLPVQLSTFIGREREMDEVKELLSRTRLLTITGTGGAGKTRLSLQVAADLLDDYPDGIWLVELAPLADPALVPQTVAAALGIREEPGRPIPATLAEQLRPRSCLLVLDSCEHVLGESAVLADELLRSCAGLRVLATSREALGIVGETPYHLRSLSLPPVDQEGGVAGVASSEAARLFVERAQDLRPDFGITEPNAAAVAQICRRLDGIPLAIELAAARVRAMPVEDIANGLDDRFRLLTGGSRAALPRQRTLQALIDWSHDLLTDQEKALLRRLSVFAGGWTLPAAEAVCSGEGVEDCEVVDVLMSLVDKSLVVCEQGPHEMRYRMLETIHEYARERLSESGEEGAVRERHRDFFVEYPEQVKREVGLGKHTGRLDRLAAECDNFRAALQCCWATDEGVELGLALTTEVGRLWAARGPLREAREQIAVALARGAHLPAAKRAPVLFSAGWLAVNDADYPAARKAFEECLRMSRELGHEGGVGHNLTALGHVALGEGDPAKARRLFEKAVQLRRDLGADTSVVISLCYLALAAALQGDHASAKAASEDALAAMAGAGTGAWLGYPLNRLGVAACLRQDYAEASALLAEGLAAHAEAGENRGVAECLSNLGYVALCRRDLATARERLLEGMKAAHEVRERPRVAECLRRLGCVCVADGQLAHAARLLGAAHAVCEEAHATLPQSEREQYERCIEGATDGLGAEAYEAAAREGKAMSLDEAVTCALDGP